MAFSTPLSSTTRYGVVKIGSGIDVTDGIISVTPNGIINVTSVTDAQSPYAVASDDYYIGAIGAGAGITINLPVGVVGRVLIIKSEAGQLSDVTIVPNGAQTIENAASYTILAATDGSITLVFRNTNWNVV
jgi:2-keto-3-deoxy-6-phosphogluconate aldolase